MSNYETKPVTASKTVWVNAITFALAVLALLVGQDWVKDHPQWVAWIGIATSVLNVILRMVSNQAVTLFGPSSRRFK